MPREAEFDRKRVKAEPEDDYEPRRKKGSGSHSPEIKAHKKSRRKSRSLSPPRQYRESNRVKQEEAEGRAKDAGTSKHPNHSRARSPDQRERRRPDSPPRRRPEHHSDGRHRTEIDPRRERDNRRAERHSPQMGNRGPDRGPPPRRSFDYYDHPDENVSRDRDRRNNPSGEHSNRVRPNSPRDSHDRRDNQDSRKLGQVLKKEPNNDEDQDREENKRKKLQDMRGKQRNRGKEEQVDSSKFAWGKTKEEEEEKEPEVPKEKPDFGLSGKLAVDTNTFNGVVVKYNEPPEARKPKLRWRLYPFKGDEPLPVLHIHRQSAYLIGKDRKVADIPVDHPSCSRQHAAFQYRAVPVELADGRKVSRIKPYIIDLGSANGTCLNNNKIEASRYYELREKDVLKFGFSSREYVVLNEKSKDVEPEEHSDRSGGTGGSPQPTETETEGQLDGL